MMAGRTVRSCREMCTVTARIDANLTSGEFFPGTEVRVVLPRSLGVAVPHAGIGIGHTSLVLRPKIGGAPHNPWTVSAQPAGWMRAPPSLSFAPGLAG